MLAAPYTVSVARSMGILNVVVPAFIPADAIIVAPDGATHYSITAISVEADFASNTSLTDTMEPAVLPINATASVALNLQVQLTPGAIVPLPMALSVSFYQAVNGINYLLRNGASNALAIVRVDV